MIEDAFCSLAWLHANADQYGFDSQRIALFGYSGGGLIAAFLAAADDPALFMNAVLEKLHDQKQSKTAENDPKKGFGRPATHLLAFACGAHSLFAQCLLPGQGRCCSRRWDFTLCWVAPAPIGDIDFHLGVCRGLCPFCGGQVWRRLVVGEIAAYQLPSILARSKQVDRGGRITTG